MGEPLLVALLGATIIVTILLRSGLDAVGLPALTGYIVLGFLARLLDARVDVIPANGELLLDFLSHSGVIALLFRVGLESEVSALWDQLGRAWPVWLGSIAVSGLLGYAAARWALGLDLVAALFVGVALTATSVGVSLGAWRSADALDTRNGALLVDTVELDDFSGVVLMALLFAVAPALRGGAGAALGPELAGTTAVVLFKAALFLGFCFLFSRYAEERVTEALRRISEPYGLALVVAGIGILIASLAEVLGFSFAIGAFFAGLVFARDPESVKIDASFSSVYALFVPFFFLRIGFDIDPGAVAPALVPAAVLGLVAIVGKVAGTGLPAWPTAGLAGATVLGVSVVPRAEITMVIMERGRALGDWAVPPRIYGGAILVTLVTCLVFPVLTRWLLDRWPEAKGGPA